MKHQLNETCRMQQLAGINLNEMGRGRPPVSSDIKDQLYLYKIILADGETFYRIMGWTQRNPETFKKTLLKQAIGLEGKEGDRTLYKKIRDNKNFNVELVANDSDKEKLQKQAKKIASEDPDYGGIVSQLGHSSSESSIKVIPIKRENILVLNQGKDLYVSDVALMQDKELSGRINTKNFITLKGSKYWKINNPRNIKIYGDPKSLSSENPPNKAETELIITKDTTPQEIMDFIMKFRKNN